MSRLGLGGRGGGAKRAKTEPLPQPQLLGAGWGRHRWRPARLPHSPPSGALSWRGAVWGLGLGAGWMGPRLYVGKKLAPGLRVCGGTAWDAAPIPGAPSGAWLSLWAPSLHSPRPQPVPVPRLLLASLGERISRLERSAGGGAGAGAWRRPLSARFLRSQGCLPAPPPQPHRGALPG